MIKEAGYLSVRFGKHEQFQRPLYRKNLAHFYLKNKIIDVYRKKPPGFINLKDTIKAEQEHQSFINISNNLRKTSVLPAVTCLYQNDLIVNKELAVALQNCIQ